MRGWRDGGRGGAGSSSANVFERLINSMCKNAFPVSLLLELACVWLWLCEDALPARPCWGGVRPGEDETTRHTRRHVTESDNLPRENR